MGVAVGAPERVRLSTEVRGNVARLWDGASGEVVVAGPAGTGKTRAILEWVHWRCSRGTLRVLFLRKTLESLKASALVTFRDQVLYGFDGKRSVADDVAYFGGNRILPGQFSYGETGSTITLGGMDNPSKVLSTEYDIIYCFVGETRVHSPSAIEKAFVREYSGPLVTIRTAGGNELTGTPNHPILTDKGWVALGLLDEGDHVIGRRFVQDEGASGNPHVDDEPPTIAEVARSLALSPTGRSERVETVGVDFHGDGERGYVDVVSADGELHGGRDAPISQPPVEGERVGGNLQAKALVGSRAGGFVFFRVLRSAVGTPCAFASARRRLSELRRRLPSFAIASGGRTEVFRPLRTRISDVPILGRVALGAGGEAVPTKLGLERGVADAEGRRDLEQPALAGEVAPDRVVHVERSNQADGSCRHVYNLQTSNHYYFANNIISHNCNECSELDLDEWEQVTGRTDRPRLGPLPAPSLVIGDCNPGPPTHWIRRRADAGLLQLWPTTHRDNPAMWDAAAGRWTESGRRYLRERLMRLTGVRRERFLLGKWVAAEGQVYDAWDDAVHVVSRRDVASRLAGAWHLGTADWGWSSPGGCQVWAVDGDERLALVAEHYHTKRPFEGWWVPRFTSLDVEFEVAAWYCDPAEPENIARLQAAGLNAVGATNAILPGINAVQDRLVPAGDGLPRLVVVADALRERDEDLVAAGLPWSTTQEVGRYVWAKDVAGHSLKDRPVDAFNHGWDQVRYAAAALDLSGAARPLTAADLAYFDDLPGGFG